MSNPYRVRPSRSRVDPTVAGYGINQKPWNPGSVQRPPNIDSTASIQAPPPSLVNQTKPNDSWDWNVDNGNNGNDSWNWSVDHSETQKNQHMQQQHHQLSQQVHHQLPQQQQQHQFPPQQLPPQLQQHQFSPQQPQQQYPPQNQKQQFPPQQVQQKLPPLNQQYKIPPQQHHHQLPPQQHQLPPQHQQQPLVQHQLPPQNQFISSFTNLQQTTPSSAGQENYYKNLNGNDHRNTNINQNITLETETPKTAPPVTEPTPKQSDPFAQLNNYSNNQQFATPPRPGSNASAYSGSADQSQWPNDQHSQSLPYSPSQMNSQKQSHQTQLPPQTSQQSVSVNNYNWSNTDQQNVLSNSWPNNTETPSSSFWTESVHEKSEKHLENSSNNFSQQSLPSNNSWSQAEEANPMPNWQQAGVGNIPNSQWRQPKLQPGGSLEESALSENNKGDWHPVQALPSHFNSSTTSTTSGSLANMSSSTEQLEDRKRSLTPTTSFTSLNEFQTQVSNSIQNNVESFPQSHVDLDWGADTEWNTVSDLSTSVNNMNLNSKYQPVDNPSTPKEEHVAQAAGDWSHQPVSSLKVENIENKPDNLSILTSEEKSIESPASVSQEQFDLKQQSTSKSTENVYPANYEQWYKQNVRTQPENDFYGNNSEKQWPVEQNVENYENVQQPAEFVNLEVVAPESQDRDLYDSRESINKETLENDQILRQITPSKEAVIRDFQQEINNMEVPTMQQIQQPLQSEQSPDNYEFASNDRNTFLETGELTDSHSQEQEPLPLMQDEENDEVPNDIPFLREVPGQSSSIDPRRNDPTGQEQYAQGVLGAMAPRMSDPRRNDPSGQEQQQNALQNRSGMSDRSADKRDVPSGQERTKSVQPQQQPRNNDFESVERRNDPSSRKRSLPLPQQSRNEPSGEEQPVSSSTAQSNQLESSVVREIPGRGNELEEVTPQPDSGFRQIPGGASSNESVQIVADDRSTVGARVVTGSQQSNSAAPSLSVPQDSSNDNKNKREEAVGAPIAENQSGSGPANRRDSYEDGDDEGSGNSREDSRDRRRESSPKSSRHSRYDYNRKTPYYDRERDYEEDYYDRRRPADFERSFDSREEMVGRDYPSGYREDDRRHANRDDLERDRDRERDRRNDLDRRSRMKDDIDDREGRRRIDDIRRDRSDPRLLDRENREFDPRYRGDRDYGDRGRDRRLENGRPRRYPEYDSRDSRDNYKRDYYDDSYNRNSRPSSRSSYNDRDRDYYMRPTRDMYSSYGYNNYPGYDYGPNYNRDYYAYLENLRRTDPVAYAEWYHKYYQHQQQISRGPTSSTYPEDRASVHSGRSSCDDRNSSDKRNLTDVSLLEDQTVASSRLTPTKFSTAHTKGIFSIGALLHVHAAYPTDGERARIDILKMDQILQLDSTLRELRYYPGPLIKGVTHKKTIIEYCENKIKKASLNDEIVEVSSYVLLYELMIMLIQQNGNVVGVDIASLLLRNKEAFPYEVNKPSRENNRRESTVSQRSSASGGDKSVSNVVQPLEKKEQIKPQKSVEELTNEFRNTLLYGLVQEALEFAMVEGLWGHALFLASKLDKRTHASVMTRFANSLSPQDPLQTLYQLHSGRVPASVTCVSDAKWDDWRPHLAMIISNTSANPEINRRAISNLGDTLAGRNDIYAAHFCYILSQVDFGAYGSSNVKLVLIGANHHKPYSEFISAEAVLLTEIYEYARKLSEPFTLTELQTFKFNMAVKMVDYGLVEKALLYIEQVAVNIANEPEKYKQEFINNVYILGDRLKYHDPVCKDSDDDVANLPWLNNLSEIVGKCEKGEIVQGNNHALNNSYAAETNSENAEVQHPQQNWNASYDNSSMVGNLNNDIGNWQPKSTTGAGVGGPYGISAEREIHYSNETTAETHSQYPSYQQDYWASQQQQLNQQQTFDHQDYVSPDYSQPEWQKPDQQDAEHSDHQNKWTYESEKSEEKPAEKESIADQQQQPNISMGPSGSKQYDPLEELEKVEPSRLGAANKAVSEGKKQTDKPVIKKSPNSSGGGGWFNGLISKLVPQPKNQMILPDDSNPSIVWDPVTEKWLNKDDEDGGSAAPLAPPPKMSELPGFKSTPTPTSAPVMPSNTAPPAPMNTQTPKAPVTAGLSVADETMNSSKMITGSGNMYKLSRSRNMRANYVDVMNPGGSKTSNSTATTPAPTMTVPTPIGSPALPMAASSPQLFIPAPVTDPNAPLDFLTPVSAAVPQTNENPQTLSRWSSASSLSREVQSYTMRDPRLLQRDKGPMMYNPMDVKDRSQKNQARSRYPPR